MTQISRLMFGLLALLIVGSPAAQTTCTDKPVQLVVGFPTSPELLYEDNACEKSFLRIGNTKVAERVLDVWGTLCL